MNLVNVAVVTNAEGFMMMHKCINITNKINKIILLFTIFKKIKMIFKIVNNKEIKRFLKRLTISILILILDKKVKAVSGQLKLSNLKTEIREVFAITRLDQLFDIKDDEADALAAF